MRLLIVGTLKGQLTAATKMAMDRGASVTHAERIETASGGAAIRQGRRPPDGGCRDRHPRPRAPSRSGAHSRAGIVACGTKNDAPAAVAGDLAPGPRNTSCCPDPEMIAAVLAAVADDRHDLVYRDEG